MDLFKTSFCLGFYDILMNYQSEPMPALIGNKIGTMVKLEKADFRDGSKFISFECN